MRLDLRPPLVLLLYSLLLRVSHGFIKCCKCGHSICLFSEHNSDDFLETESVNNVRLSLNARRREKRLSTIKPFAAPNSLVNITVLLDPSIENIYAEPYNLGLSGGDCELLNRNHEYVRFYGFDELFPQSNFGNTFHGNHVFTADLRKAARIDFVSTLPLQDSIKKTLVNDMDSSVQSSWRVCTTFPSMNSVFKKWGISLTGEHFIDTLAKLCGNSPHVFGSWMDIVGVRNRYVKHSWHQDSGKEQRTVMVGFPAEVNYTGLGVFSHIFKLSHRLPPPLIDAPRVWDDVVKDGRDVGSGLIVRPIFTRGREIMVYDDRDVFHSAPDYAYRSSIWRLM